MMGLSMTFDMTPVTRLTASEDIQRLMAGGNLQTSAQVGASETDTTMVQIVHTAEKLKLTGQFQLIETQKCGQWRCINHQSAGSDHGRPGAI